MLQVRETKELMNTLFELDIFSDETKDRVHDADLILLPEIDVFEGFKKAFRPNTKSFYKFALAHHKANYKIELFENKGEEKILSFHSWDIYLPVLYLRNKVLLPNVIELICEYVDFKTKNGRHDEPIVNLILKVEDGEICKEYAYKGLVEGLKEAFNNSI